MSPLFLILVFSLFSHSSSLSTTLSLSPTAVAPPPLTNPWQRLNHLAAASSTRAHHLKHPRTNASSAKVPLFPRGYGGYSISLSFGAPPQSLSFVMDTGSSLVWFPCTQRYSCSSCNFASLDPANIPVFIPKSSSSSRIVGCKNPKCNWLFPSVQCRDCDKNSTACNETCPPYVIEYGSGSTTGLLLSESLIFPEKSIDNFVVGCSVFSTRLPSGIAGFGRGPESLPSQLGLTRFSYCLVSHKFDDNTTASSDLILSAAPSKGGATKYTPFRKNPTSSNPAFQDYYYKFMVADADGSGGAIVDSGTTFTFLEKQVFELVAREFEKQVGSNYSRALEVENQSGLRPCFNVSGENVISLPQLTFHFKGGAKMILPLADYFSFLDDSAICMTIVTNNGTGGEVGPGPAIILGNYQQQNFYMEYDLENDRLGFHEQLCQ
ncbi:aspartic proteinase nepenthesin-2 [Phtheirospermum japonicum]|uniref:Aspartic proteinase nepenthesin-2 n=1 Tax=Phtheirospermum japonicum TaxID=374723 RepID=A0A830CE48_9LAMI|nr:aspartic proteinase nepenthesin-2 [Phtheirospermum japonicum]